MTSSRGTGGRGEIGQHQVKEPTESGGTRRYSCDTSQMLRAAEMQVRGLRDLSLTRKRSEVQILRRPPADGPRPTDPPPHQAIRFS